MSKTLPGNCRLLPLTARGDDRGLLVAVEGQREVPFAIARVYHVYATLPGVVRGLHAHRALNQLAVAVQGSCMMLLDDGIDRVSVRIDDPAIGLTLPPMVWHEMSEFSDDCVLMVLADAGYDEADYIRDYGEFSAMVRA